MNVIVALLTPAAGNEWDPLRYCHWTGFPFASYNPTQSPAVPGAFAIVAVATPPAGPLDVGVTLGALVAIVPLVATRGSVELNTRAGYLPLGAGSRNTTVAKLT